METLLIEIRAARMASIAGEFEIGERRVRQVLDLIDEVKPVDSRYHLARAIRGYVAEAGFALLQVDSPRAVSALDEAVRVLENNY